MDVPAAAHLPPCEEWCAKMQSLLEVERACEAEETKAALQDSSAALEAKGVRLRHLIVADVAVGLAGRVQVELRARGGNQDETILLPVHRFGTGDTVRMTRMDATFVAAGAADLDESAFVEGVVSRVKRNAITIALGKEADSSAVALVQQQLDLIADETTFRRMSKALETLASSGSDAVPLRAVLFGGHRAPKLRPGEPVWKPFGSALNDSQREAISFCLRSQDVAVIHGPPGTGKTTTVAELIKQFLAAGLRVLACAPSNVAVDNLLEKLASFEPDRYRPVRLGHPARLLPSVLSFAMENVISTTDSALLCRDIRQELALNARSQSKAGGWEERKQLRNESRALRSELRVREKKAVHEVIARSRLVMATLTGCADRALRDAALFDVVVIDEAGQALEAACWIAMLRGSRVVLAGDHMQLPPTVTSSTAAKAGLGITLLDRLVAAFGDSATRMLQVQYRMHETIMSFSSHELYHDKLVAADSVRSHLLRDLVKTNAEDDVDDDDLLSFPLLFIDTAGCHLDETQQQDSGSSRENEGEALLVAQHVQSLVDAGIAPADIAVITPYNAQVSRVRALLSVSLPAVEVGSVDGFQGREKEAIVISLVRSNMKRDVGFLSDFRRMNVAITRARRHVCIVGNSLCVSSDAFLRKMVEYAEEHGDYRGAQSDMTRDVVGVMKAPPASGAAKVTPQQQVAQRTLLATPTFRELMADRLRTFKAGGARRMLMPADLNSAQRRMVHEVAAELKLFHLSEGVGAERAICVSKDPFVVDDAPAVAAATTTTAVAATEDLPARNDDDEPPSSVAEASVVAAAAEPAAPAEAVGVSAPAKTKAKTKKSKTANQQRQQQQQQHNKAAKVQVASVEPLDLEAEVTKQRIGKCFMGSCTELPTAFMQTIPCRFCAHIFCGAHRQPEAHGCGSAATAAARKEFLERGKQKETGTKPLTGDKRDLAQRMLQKKLDKEREKRAPKPPTKKK